jgi:membrane associated rhomboid family serine protease
MFIIGDETHSNGRLPWITGALIVANVLTFLLQQSLGQKFTYGYSLVPLEIVKGRDFVKPKEMKIKVPVRAVEGYGDKRRVIIRYKDEWVKVPQYRGPFPIYLTLLTSMFLHANWFHLVGNLWFLGVFGRNVETALGHGRFLMYYLICGVAGGLVHTLSDPDSVIPSHGASGAISGVMGSYLAIYPLNKIKIWLGWLWGVVDVPAFVVLGVWMGWQYVSAVLRAEIGNLGGGVAYWDHLGGFAAGLLLIPITIAYLRWQISRMETAEERAVAQGVGPPTAPEPVDPFGSCLPAPQPTGRHA